MAQNKGVILILSIVLQKLQEKTVYRYIEVRRFCVPGGTCSRTEHARMVFPAPCTQKNCNFVIYGPEPLKNKGFALTKRLTKRKRNCKTYNFAKETNNEENVLS